MGKSVRLSPEQARSLLAILTEDWERSVENAHDAVDEEEEGRWLEYVKEDRKLMRAIRAELARIGEKYS